MFTVVKDWFYTKAGHVTFAFLPDPRGEELDPEQGYVRIWLDEGFLAEARTWGNDHFAALHGGVKLGFGDAGRAEFSTFTRSPQVVKSAGAQLNFPLTPLLPYFGGLVEVQAALYRATVKGALASAAHVAGALAGLIGPPLATAAAIAGKVSAGLDVVLDATGNQPVLGVHCTFESAGGGGRVLRSGHTVIVDAPPGSLGGTLCMSDGLLHLDTGSGPRRLTGVDYLVLRVECRTEPEIWLTPPIQARIDAAGLAYLAGRNDFKALRTEAVAAAWTLPDLVHRDRIRLAKLVAAKIDEVKQLGAVPSGGDETRALPAVDDPALAALRFEDLLA
ncbi:hypothetical protein Daura_16310 [Dactylosporangium aurantiacum]|uniref:Uncharacterized protein n=1 Tax=Dactylosporangium aurantiacum TaxID=35754 RepID=A0A9Q9MQH2_9ACTN|nr:hypothetical protein [Dactylosporangium aurantiacum]MDG6103070.1 hypothetical protein [Dactylosporangium aurantiacum]UWZ57582.1 hypothetical protein Daura_16310 [Dactylosporangium aurantiacum]